MVIVTQKTNTKRLLLWLLMVLLITGFSSVQAQMVTVTPTEYPNALANPLMGFRPDLNKAGNPAYPFPRLVRDYIKWSEIENHATDDAQKIIDFCNQRWANLPEKNVKVIPRVYVDWDSKSGNEYWPADILSSTGLAATDAALWRTQIVKNRIINLISKLGQAWNNDSRIAWVQTGILGYWGEQENPVGTDEEGYAKLLGDAFAAAFPNKKLVVRNQPDWDAQGHKFGVYWDSYGHPGQRSGAWTKIINTNATGRYLTEVIEGEVAYNWGESTFDPLYGGDPDITLGNTQYTNNMIDVIRELHCTGLGWIASYSSGNATIEANANRIQKEFGYRFLLPEFTCSARANQGGTLNVGFKVKNVGSAPFYENWQVAFVLIDATTRQIVWKEVLPDIDVRSWHPGNNYNYTSRVYQTPALVYSYNKTITVPGTVVTGQYLAGITILEPSTQKPGIFFAVPNFFKESQTQPLCRIGIGTNATNNLLTGVLFNNPVTDDARYYNSTPAGPTYSITTNPSSGGFISPANGNFAQNSTITVTAFPNSGYKFDSWGGALSGSANPTTLLLNANKTISASFTAVPPEKIPWVENFDGLADGTTQKGLPTSWTLTPTTGNFKVLSNEMAFNNVGANGVFTTGQIDISSGPVIVSLKVRGGTGLDLGQDFLRLYKKVDGGAEVQIGAADGPQAEATWTANIATGSRLELIIRAYVSANTEYYYFDDLSVISSGLTSIENRHIVEDISAGNNVKVYPNPVSKTLYVKTDNSTKPSNIEIYSLNGRLLYSVKPTNSTTWIDTKTLKSKGIVIVKVTSEKDVTLTKVTLHDEK